MITDAELTEWKRRTDLDRPDDEALADPLWRLAHLYSIKDRNGQVVPFEPNREQAEVIISIHCRGWRRILIPKARQLGMSTVLAIICLDFALFAEGFQAALVDRKADEAEKKMREKVRLAWELLPADLRGKLELPAGYDTTTRIGFKSKGSDEAASCMEVGINYRGGTVQLLWVSEWGWIQANDANRSKEIAAGSLPAAEEGIVVVETTWEGGKSGDVWPLVKEATETPEPLKGPKSWRILFFSWFTNPGYAQTHGHIDSESGDYLKKLQQEHGIKLTTEQKLWYSEKRRTLGSKVLSEYPSTLEECWTAPVPGAIYAEYMHSLRAQSRILPYEWDRNFPVYTFWDLGAPAQMVVWYVQFIGREIHIIDCDGGLDLTTSQRIAHMNGKGYNFAEHLLPHDAAAKQKGGLTFTQELSAAGLVGRIRVVPITADPWRGIDRLRGLLSRCWFRLTKSTQRGVEALEAYRAKVDDSGNVTQLEPVHDWSSHYCDALRTMAEAEAQGMLKFAGGIGTTTADTRERDRPRRRQATFNMA